MSKLDLDAIKKALDTPGIYGPQGAKTIAALVAEVEMHRKLRGADCMYINQLCKERDQLKAENERQQTDNQWLMDQRAKEWPHAKEHYITAIDQLKAENERLKQNGGSYSCGAHGWRHGQSPCPECAKPRLFPSPLAKERQRSYEEGIAYMSEWGDKIIAERDSALAKLQTCREEIEALERENIYLEESRHQAQERLRKILETTK